MDYDKIKNYRITVNAELKKKDKINQKIGENPDQFYILSVDVGRLGCETVICVFKVLPQQSYFIKKLVNIEVLPERLHFEHQAARIKEMIQAYDPKEVVIDGNGLGIGLMDYMIQYNKHDITNIVYPPYGTTNDDDYKSKQPSDCKKLIWVMKAGANIQGEIDSTCFSELVSGRIRFLISESAAKTKLLKTEAGKKMPVERRIRVLKPYTLTSILIDEILNLRIKDGNIAQRNLTLERINSGRSKDKFSAFEYGLYRIKSYEVDYYKKKMRTKRDLKQFMLFSKRG